MIDTSAVTNPAPQGAYQTERFGNFAYTFSGFTTTRIYTVRLHFAELSWTAGGQRLFNVAINGTSVLNNFDIFATAGAQNRALTEQFTAVASASGSITIAFTQGSAKLVKFGQHGVVELDPQLRRALSQRAQCKFSKETSPMFV